MRAPFLDPSRTAALVAVLLLPLVLTGCASPLVVHERHGVAADPAALALAWSTPAAEPDWLPADATRIRWVARTRGGADRTPAALRARSAAPLPTSCRTAGRVEDAAITASWTPDGALEHVRRCGRWAVAPVPGGWYGWTPVAEGGGTG